ncbi:MAG: hypothetical protein EOO11_08995, partial [Chitinophagaceae bacterium]
MQPDPALPFAAVSPVCDDVHLQFASFFPDPALQPYAYLVSSQLAEGHTCLNLSRAGALGDQLPERLRAAWAQDPSALQRSSFVGTQHGSPRPFILHNERLYLQRYFYYETQILERLGRFAAEEHGYRDARDRQLTA